MSTAETGATPPMVRVIGEAARAPKTAEIIATSIRRSIVRGELNEGDGLPSEADLMEQFSVSRPTLREAFRILETESLISIRRGSRGGARVMAPELSTATRYVGLLLQMQGTTVGEVFEARSSIEVGAARLLATKRKISDVASLRDLVGELSAMVGGVKEKDPSALAAWIDASMRFHGRLVEFSGNRPLLLQWSLLSDVINGHARDILPRTVDHPQTVEVVRKSLRSYEKLLGYIEAGDASGAADHWQKHMEVSAKILTGRGEAGATISLFE